MNQDELAAVIEEKLEEIKVDMPDSTYRELFALGFLQGAAWGLDTAKEIYA